MLKFYTCYNEFTSTIFVAQVGEAPHVSQANSETNTAQQEVSALAPCFSLGTLVT